MTLEEILSRVSADYGTDEFVPDAEGVYRVQCDQIELSIAPRESGLSVLFSAPVIEVPERLSAKISLVILQVNHLFRGGEGASFSIDPETKRFCLQQEVALTENADAFAARMSCFLSFVERWYILLGAYLEQLQSGEGLAESGSTDAGVEGPEIPVVPSEWISA